MEEEVSLHSFWGVGTPPILQLPSAGAAHPCCRAQAPATSKVAAVSLFPDLLSMAKFQSKINSKVSKSFHIYLNSGFKLKPRWVFLSRRPTSPWLCFLVCKMGEIRTCYCEESVCEIKGAQRAVAHEISAVSLYLLYWKHHSLAHSHHRARKSAVPRQARHNPASSNALASSRTQLLSAYSSSNVFIWLRIHKYRRLDSMGLA